MFHRGPAQPALGRPQERLSAACSCASCSCASCVLQGAARPPSLAELIFRLHSVACLSSLGPTVLFSMFSSFPDADAKVQSLRTAERLSRPISSARDAEAPDGLTHRCLLSGFFQTGLARPTFSWEFLSYLFGLVFSQSRHSWQALRGVPTGVPLPATRMSFKKKKKKKRRKKRE